MVDAGIATPIARLPVDLLRYIFHKVLFDHEALPEGQLMSDYEGYVRGLLGLTCVCRFWSEIALTTPTLWSTISSTLGTNGKYSLGLEGQHDETLGERRTFRYTKEWLARSKAAPLDVIMRPWSMGPTGRCAWDLLMNQKHRWRSWAVREAQMGFYLKDCLNALADTPLPLRWCSFSARVDEEKPKLITAPALRYLCFDGFNPFTGCSSLRYLATDHLSSSAWLALSDFVRETPTIETLVLNGSAVDPMGKLEMPGLQSLIVTTPSVQGAIAVFASLLAPNLEFIRAGVSMASKRYTGLESRVVADFPKLAMLDFENCELWCVRPLLESLGSVGRLMIALSAYHMSLRGEALDGEFEVLAGRRKWLEDKHELEIRMSADWASDRRYFTKEEARAAQSI